MNPHDNLQHTANAINALDFDHAFTLHPDGSITDAAPGVHAPDLCDETIESDAWEFASRGMSNQDRYDGPILHSSEFVSAGMVRTWLEEADGEPVALVLVVAYYTEEVEDGEPETYPEGWAVLRYLS